MNLEKNIKTFLFFQYFQTSSTCTILYTHAHMHTRMHARTQARRQAGRQAGKQSDRQTDRQTDSSCLWLMWFVEHTQAVDGLDTKLPVYANATEMALKLKTSAERKASKQRKYKKEKNLRKIHSRFRYVVVFFFC